MRQLTGLDTSFLNFETASMPLHVASMTVIKSATPDGRPVGCEQIRATLESRLHLLPPFRWKLVTVPLGVDHPYWVDDPDFDIEFHLRELAVPAPGTDEQLAEIVARVHARPLDRSRPLWEMYVITGLASGDTAVYTKMHHAAIDGVSGAEILTILLDLEPDAPPRETEAPVTAGNGRLTSAPGVLVRAGLNLARRPWELAATTGRTVKALPYLGAMAKGAIPGLRGDDLLERPRLQAPATPFNATITPHRRFAFGSVPLDEVKAVKNKAGVTVNDVVMAMCAGAVRRYLLDHDALPDAPLQAMVPISVRTEGQRGAMGNQVSAMVAMLPTHLATPAERLAAAHEAMQSAKSNNAVPADLLQDYTQFVAPAVAATAARTVSRLRWADRLRTPINLVISNVPGPPFPLYFAGAELQHLYPVSAISDGVGLNITLQSYNGTIDFGLVACREMAPDLWTLLGYLTAELSALGG